jgi:signal transduction histidine kinase
MRTETSQYFIKMAYPVVLIMVVCVMLLVWSLYQNRVQQTEMVSQLSEKTMEATLAESNKNLNLLTLDYAFWDETLVFSRTLDPEWAKKQVGLYLSETFNLSGSLLLDQKGQVIWRYLHDINLPKQALEKAFSENGLIERLVLNWDSVPPKIVSGYLQINDKLFSLHAGLLTSDESNDPLEPENRIALVLLKVIDQTYLDNISSQKLVDDLYLEQITSLSEHEHREQKEDGAVEAHLPLYDLRGQVIGQLSWYPDHRLGGVYKGMKPWLLAFIVISGSCFLWYVYRVHFAASLLDKEIRRREQVEKELEEHKRDLQKQVDERTEALYDALVQANAASDEKSRFTEQMSHEMRTPLNSIIGFSQLLQADALGSEQEESIDEILNAGHRLLGIVNQVLNLADFDQNHDVQQSKTCKLHEIMGSLLPFYEQVFNGKGLEFNVDDCTGADCLDEDSLDERCLNTQASDAERYSNKHHTEGYTLALPASAFSNAIKTLLDNAGHYSVPPGRVQLVVSCQDNLLEFQVMDTGIGLTEQQQAQLFQPFSRLHFEQLPNIEGIGLGLFMARKQLEQYNAKIEYVNNGQEIGSCFRLLIPLA